MSAPDGFNPNASLLPDPGSIPIQTMKGGANITKAPVEVAGDFSPEELTELALYQLEPGGVIEHDIDSSTKKEFLKQIKDKSRCRRTTGDSIILGKDCWAIVKVTRALLKAKLNKTNSGAPLPAPLPRVNASVGSNSSTANVGVGTSQLTRQDDKRNLGTGRYREGGPENGFSNNESNGEENAFSNNESNGLTEENAFSNNESNGEENDDRNENQTRPSPCVRVISRKNRSNSGSNSGSNGNSGSNSGSNGNSENQSRPSPCVRVVTRKNRSNSGSNTSGENEDNNETQMEKYERNRMRSRENNRQGRKSLGIENENEDNEDNQNEDNNETQMEKYERNRIRSRENNRQGRKSLGIENESNGASENENARNEGDVDKIDELDNWVIGNYDKKVPEKETFTYYTKKDASYIKELTGVQSKYNDLIKKWKTVVTVGDGHCLIHALFTSLLPSYRKIKYDDRGKIGETFRHTVFADLFEGADKKFVKGRGFLEEKHLDMFVNTYKINVFVLRNVRNGKTVSFELHTVDNEMLNEFDWIAINDTLDGHFSSILMGDKFRLTSDEFIDSYDRFFEQFAKDGEFEQLKANIKKNIVKLAPNDLKNDVEGYREAIGRTTEIGKLKDLIKQVESAYGLKNGDILNKYKGRIN